MAEDDAGTRMYPRISRPAVAQDPVVRMKSALAQVRLRPKDPQARRILRGLAAELGAWEQLALLLDGEAHAATATRPDVAAAFFEELADVHDMLDQPLETIAAMESVVSLLPADVDHCDRLAKLYHRAGAWTKAAETFEHVAALTTDDRARTALRAAGRLYREHGDPERAIEIYREIVARKPSDLEAWSALDDLYSELERWYDVALVRGEIADRSASGVDKAMALRGQARALEQAGEPDAAAELVELATQYAPDDVSGLVDYASILARGGKGREAADLLAERVRASSASRAGSAELAALRLRLSAILDDVCDDHAGAVIVLDELLAEKPDYVPALERLVAHAALAADAHSHADALLRHAAALPDPLDRAALLIEAGRKFRDAADHREAARAFESACALAPDDEDLRRELDDEHSAVAVDRAHDELARGEAASAERRLRNLLGLRPFETPANLALTDLLERAGRLADAAHHLEQTLAAVPDNVPRAQLAPLLHRHALVTAALGNEDAAHQMLHEAHHLDRRSLLITLALGESCFRRKLWREAAIHLGSLAEHPDARKHAAAVGVGLVHAGRAEARALRPANASKHYEAAVRIDPGCAPGWRALAELARERGETERAAQYFEREAAATTEPRDRVRLFDVAGDLALDVLGDPARAERCWSQVAALADASVLDKLLALQRKRGARTERAETCERLAAVAKPPRQKELVEEAAEAFAADDELPRASALAEWLATQYPRDVDAIACASAVAIAARDVARAAGWLASALQAWDASGDRRQGDPRRADLWRRLGDAERARGDDRAAQLAYERAVSTAPESDGALGAQRGLVELAASAGRPAGASLAAIVEADQHPADILAYARELAKMDKVGDAYAMLQLARALGAPHAEEDERQLQAAAPRPMDPDEAYGALPAADRRALVDGPGDEPLAELCELIGEAASLVCPDAKTALGRAGLADATRVAATGKSAAAAMSPKIANALGGVTTLLYEVPRPIANELSIVLASPPIVVLGSRLGGALADVVGPRADAELRFRLGRVVELARPRRIFAVGQPAPAFARLVAALRLAFGRSDDAPVDRALAIDAERLRQAFTVQLRRRFTDYFVVFGQAGDPDEYRAECERAADRAGLLACGSAGVAIELAGGPAVARHLVQLASGARYLAARRALRPRRGSL